MVSCCSILFTDFGTIFRHCMNPNRTSKSDFWPFYWFLPFSHWNSHCNRKKLRTAEGVVLQQKQKVFRNLWTKWNNMKPCRSWINQIFWIRITLTPQGHACPSPPIQSLPPSRFIKFIYMRQFFLKYCWKMWKCLLRHNMTKSCLIDIIISQSHNS